MWARLALAAAAVTTLVGCNGGATGTAARPTASEPAPATVTQTGVSNGLAAVASTYSLVAIDGHGLPYTRVSAEGPSSSPTQVISGTLVLQANGTFTMSTKYRATEPQGVRVFDGKFDGACAPDGDAYRLYWNGGGETPLTANGDTVTVNNNGTLFRYVRVRAN
jgi:hypothetical protein